MPEDSARPMAVIASEAPPRPTPSTYPAAFARAIEGRIKRPLGDLFGLKNFGVNWTMIAPGGHSALHHAHARQDEFVYVLAGTPTLVTDRGEVRLSPGMCAGFAAGEFAAGEGAHHLENRSETEVVYLEIGDRTPGDTVRYPRDDVAATSGPDGRYQYSHKDGRPY